MRVSRLLALVGLLQSRGTMTANELASELGVSPRTVYRDVDLLTHAGVQVDAEHGPAGGYRMRRGSQRALLALTPDDVDAVLRALLSTELDADAGPAAARVLAALGPRAGARAQELRERFVVADPEPLIAVAARAVSQEHTLLITTNDDAERELEPLGMVRSGGVWHLVARDPATGARTTLRLDPDAVTAVPTGREFSRSSTVDLGFDGLDELAIA